MADESGLFDTDYVSEEKNNSFCDFKLLKTTAYAKLWRAIRDGKYFLIKTTKDNSEHQIAMLKREFELSIGCDNPNIVHVFVYEKNIHEGDGIVMEYIEGRTLDEFLLEKPSLETRQRIFGELLSAVNYLHKKGIIHNDLKPENIIITRSDNTLKLIDFGLADNDAFYVWKNLGCTPKYASPELLSRRNIDARSDIYSIGIIMREIFGGRYRRIINKCIKEKAEDRFSDVTALQRKWNGRNKAWKFVLSVIIILALAIPTYYLVKERFEERQEMTQQEEFLDKIKRESVAMCEEWLHNVELIYTNELSTESMNELGEVTKQFVYKWRQYQDEILSNISDPKLKEGVVLEMTLIFNEYNEKVVKLENSKI